MRDETCKDRWEGEKNDTLETIRDLWEKAKAGDPEEFDQYGLCFEFVAAGTFGDQRRGYFRYQLSFGGPSDEFRFLTEDPKNDKPDISYWFLDWFDGHGEELTGDDYGLMLEIWQSHFQPYLALHAYQAARN